MYQVFEKICRELVQNGHTKNKDSKTSLKKKQKHFKVWAESDPFYKDFETPSYATVIFYLESNPIVPVEKKNSILVTEPRQSSSKYSVTFAEDTPEINFLPRIDSEESYFGHDVDMSLRNDMSMFSTPIPAASPSTSSSSTDSKPLGSSNSAFKSVNPILPSSLRNDDIAQPTPDLGPTFDDKLNKITEIVNQTNIRSQNIESKIDQIEKNGFTNKSGRKIAGSKLGSTKLFFRIHRNKTFE